MLILRKMEKDMTLGANTTLQNGKYRIVRFINSGGFGCTYEAVHVAMSRRVAIKELFVADFCDRDADGTVRLTSKTKAKTIEKLRVRFVKEASMLFDMRHDGIVRVTDIFEENGTAYYVMEYIEGRSLADMLKAQGPLDEQTALGYIRQVADALDYVHSRNCLHLDLKPGNIMVKNDGRVVLIDFGTAKHYQAETGEATSTLLGMLTDGYAPVEQVNMSLKSFSPATDLYALGATLYKLLTDAKLPQSQLIMAGEETLAPLPSTVSAPTRRAIAAAMQPRRADRPQSVAQFLALLDGKAVEQTVVSDDPDEVAVVEVSKVGNTPQPSHDTTPTPEVKLSSNDNPPKLTRVMAWIIAAVVLLSVGTGLYYGLRDMNATEEQTLDYESMSKLENLALQCHRDGKTYWFSVDNWQRIPESEQAKFQKDGTVIKYGAQLFVLGLYDEEDGREMTWDEAMVKYESVMPTKEQGEAMFEQWEQVEAANNAFGGGDLTWYWTKTEDGSSYAWIVDMYGGLVSGNLKTSSNRVRPVAPVPVSALSGSAM